MTTVTPEASASPPFAFEPARAPRWYGAIAVVLFALILPVGYLGNEGEAAVCAAGGIAALPFVLRLRAPPVGVLILAALTLWAVASFSWSPLLPLQAHPKTYGQLEQITAPKLLIQLVLYTAFVGGALRLAADQRLRALRSLGWTLVAVTLALVVDAVVQGGVYGLFNHLAHRHPLTPDLARRDAARGCYTAALFFWPVALFSIRRTNVGVPILIALAVAASSALLGEDAPTAAILVSALLWAGVRLNPRAGAGACMVGVVVYLLAAPLVFLRGAVPTLSPAIGKASWQARLDIWRFATRLIAHRPLTGYGLDASRAFEPAIPMHPHDAALQLWLELGAPGALFAALFFGWLFYKIARVARSDPHWAAVACATGFVYVFIGAISFGVWQEWWLGAGAMAVAACGMLQQQRREVGANVADAQALQSLSSAA